MAPYVLCTLEQNFVAIPIVTGYRLNRHRLKEAGCKKEPKEYTRTKKGTQGLVYSILVYSKLAYSKN